MASAVNASNAHCHLFVNTGLFQKTGFHSQPTLRLFIFFLSFSPPLCVLAYASVSVVYDFLCRFGLFGRRIVHANCPLMGLGSLWNTIKTTAVPVMGNFKDRMDARYRMRRGFLEKDFFLLCSNIRATLYSEGVSQPSNKRLSRRFNPVRHCGHIYSNLYSATFCIFCFSLFFFFLLLICCRAHELHRVILAHLLAVLLGQWLETQAI